MMPEEKKSMNAEPQKDTAGANAYHVPVLLQEAVEALQVKPNGTYVDCTFGGGGHSAAILKQLGTSGLLIGFDQDEDARKNLPADDRFLFIPQNFRYLQRFLRLHQVSQVDGILADLGVSSHQFDEGERGFSTRFDANLDMRMDSRNNLTAAVVLQTYSENRLHKMFEQYGEVTNAKTLAKTIVAQRAISPLNTINQLKQSVQAIVKGNPHKYFAQLFQAIRIEVNDEMGALKEMLAQSATVLKPGGRIAVITFHSLEDRLVKNFFKQGSFEEVPADEIYGTRPASALKPVNKKPILPAPAEMEKNKRSRSAKLRVAEKK